MSSAAEAAADSAAYLDELTGARQTWVKQCRTALAPDAGAADWAPLTDADGAWAQALRTGRELPDPHDELPLHPEIADVNAAQAILTLARHLAGRDPADPAAAVEPLLRHGDAAHLHSIGAGSLEPLSRRVSAATTPHRDRLSALLDHLAAIEHPAAPYAALLAAHLTDTLPAAHTPATVRVLYDRDEPGDGSGAPTPGASGTLTLRLLPDGPPGLHPDPTRMAFFTSIDDGFTTSAAHAWAGAALARTAPGVSVLWNLTLDGRNPAPANDVDGGSLGAAYAIALHDLHELHQRNRRWTRHVPVLRQLDFRRTITNPYAAATGTVLDPAGTLGAVSGLDHKLAAAERAGITLVITAAGTPYDGRRPPPDVVTAPTTQRAIAQAHTHQNRQFRKTVNRVVALGLVLSLLAATAVYLGQLGRTLAQRAEDQERIAASDRLLTEAVPKLEADPRTALQLLAAATTLNPASLAVRSALVEGLAGTHYASTIDEPTGGVLAVAVSPTGLTMASGTGEETGHLTVWELSPNAQATVIATVATPTPVRALTFAPDGRTLYSGEKSGAVTPWHLRDRTRPVAGRPVAAHTAPVQEIAFATDGRVATAGSDGNIVFFDRDDSGDLRRTQTLPNEKDGVFCVAFSPDGSRLVTGNVKGEVLIWNLSDRRRPRLAFRQRVHNDLVRSVSFGADGKFLASASSDATINIWDLTTPDSPTLRETLDARGKVFQAAFAPDGHTLVGAGYARTGMLWHVPTRGPVRSLATLAGHRGYIRAAAFTPDGQVITGSLDQTMMVWNVAAAGQPTTRPEIADRDGAVRALAYSPDQHTLAAGGTGGTISLYNVDDLRAVRRTGTLTGSGEIADLAYSPDGRLLAAVDWDGVLRLWDVGNPARPQSVTQVFTGKSPQLYTVAFDRAGTRLATGGEAGDVAVLDVADASQPRQSARWPAHPMAVHAVSFDPVDPRRLATGSIDKTVRIWDLDGPTPAELLTTLPGHDEGVLAAGYSPDGAFLASGSVDATTAWWTNPESSDRAVLELSGHTLGVRTQTFTADSELITGSDDGTAAIYALVDPARPVLVGRTAPELPGDRPALDQSVLDTASSRHILATSTRLGKITLHDLTALDRIISNPHQIACSLTRTELAPDAWADRLPELPYEPSCPG